MTTRWKLIIEYDGKPFNGWQSQKDKSGVQDFLSDSIKSFSNENVKIYDISFDFSKSINFLNIGRAVFAPVSYLPKVFGLSYPT